MNKRALAIGLVILLAVVVGIILAVGHKSSPGSLSASQQAAAKQQITANWKTFFAIATPMSQHEDLLQNGSHYIEPIKSEFTAFGSHKSSATVNSIKLVNSQVASVNYTVKVDNVAVLSNQTGKAVLVNNSWKVSASTFCQLLSLAGSTPAACQNVK